MARERLRFSWTTISIRSEPQGTPLEGKRRLIALFRWLRNETQMPITVLDATGRPLVEPLQVNWANFPINEAIEAVRTSEGAPDPQSPPPQTQGI